MSTFLQKYGPTALVTGSSSGIGEEYSRVLASQGFNLVITARREERLQSLKKELERKHANIKVKVVVADLAKSEDIQKIIDETEDLDVGLLINNAGVEQFGPFLEYSIERYSNIVSVNVQAVVTLTHAIGGRLVKQGKGGIIFVSSIASRPSPYCSVYSGSKAFVTNFANMIEYEFKKANVDVLCMEPGLVHTEMSARVLAVCDLLALGVPSNTTHEAVIETLPTLGKKIVFIPGFGNRIMVFIRGLLPRSLTFGVHGAQVERLMEKQAKEVNHEG